jgi:hypothetical protein
MSWLFGITFHESRNVAEFDLDFLPACEYKVSTHNLLLCAGGIKQTCIFENDTNGWCVCGTGINNSGYSFLNSNKWGKFIQNDSFRENPPGGHYAIFRLSDKTIQGFTDPLGIREIYLGERDEVIVFSTSLEWVARFTEQRSIDPFVFGSRWLLVNQISTEPIIKNAVRLSRGQSFKIVNNSLEIDTRTGFILPDETHAVGEIKRSLSAMTVFPLEDDGKLSLSLSGGFDSRVLFSI